MLSSALLLPLHATLINLLKGIDFFFNYLVAIQFEVN